MDPRIGSAIVGGAANLAGNFVNQMYARRNAKINYEYAEKSAQDQYNRQVDFWNMQNAYNDPAAARKRMENAGMNPTTDMGSGINAAGSGSTVPGNEYAQSGMMPVVPTNWSGFAQEVANIYQTAMNGNKLVKEAAKLEMEARLASLRGTGQELDNELKEFKNNIEYMFSEDNALYDHWIKQEQFTKSQYDSANALKTGRLIDAQTDNTNAGTNRMNVLTPSEKDRIDADTQNLRDEHDFYPLRKSLASAEIRYKNAATDRERAEIRKTTAESLLLDFEYAVNDVYGWQRAAADARASEAAATSAEEKARFSRARERAEAGAAQGLQMLRAFQSAALYSDIDFEFTFLGAINKAVSSFLGRN